MRLLVGIDDTDSIDSDHGTGRVSRNLGAQLAADHGLDWVGSVRQQFLVDPRVPYTTHNSAACLVFETDSPPVEDIVADAGAYLQDVMADVADPGLCVTPAAGVPQAVTDFGHRAQESVVRKTDAYEVAAKTDVFLDEYGGTGEGVIGALGSVGLTAAGDDGRFIAYGDIRAYGERVSVERLRDDGIDVVDEAGDAVTEGTILTHDWIRPQLRGGKPTLPVEPDDEQADSLRPANLS
ncbi:hypothetical protein [Haloarchaeobius sp. DFWS5]|uniref:hypothetical protein n=1 Tax=Haloarchaeobius sp. DFWS5 TaxID=3446114 RepID=UPI003EB86983